MQQDMDISEAPLHLGAPRVVKSVIYKQNSFFVWISAAVQMFIKYL